MQPPPKPHPSEFQVEPIPSHERRAILRALEAFDRETHRPGRHGGAIGATALAVLEALMFRLPDPVTGRCIATIAAIGREARRARRTVFDALARLEECGLVARVELAAAGGARVASGFRFPRLEEVLARLRAARMAARREPCPRAAGASLETQKNADSILPTYRPLRRERAAAIEAERRRGEEVLFEVEAGSPAGMAREEGPPALPDPPPPPDPDGEPEEAATLLGRDQGAVAPLAPLPTPPTGVEAGEEALGCSREARIAAGEGQQRPNLLDLARQRWAARHSRPVHLPPPPRTAGPTPPGPRRPEPWPNMIGSTPTPYPGRR